MAAMIVRLVCVDAVGSESELFLKRFPASIGRGTEADLTINDSWASRRHCWLTCEHGRLLVRDLGSRNGTRVNGELIDESPLHSGDELTVGISTFLVSIASSESSFVKTPDGIAMADATV
jgi:pSer/pThr/pTyr-binding forkhead associated (FHA) protein